MSVTIVGTLEQIFTSGSDIVSEAVRVNFESPTDVPLPLHESIVFTERNPPVDIRDSLEAHLVDDHGFTSVTRVAVTRDGAMAEWTAIRPDSTPADIVLWFLAPLQQEGVEWGLVAVGNTSIVGSGYRSVEIGEDASSAAEGSIAIGPESTVPETSPRSVAIGEGAFIPENTPDRAVLRSKELWVRPHQDADRADSAVILQDSGGNSRTIRATAANSLTVNGVPVGGGSNTAVWGGISGTLSNQADLTAALAGKSDTGHTHTWSAITGKPSSFPPTAHTHPLGDLETTGFASSLNFLRGDGTWAAPPNTTYAEISEAEIAAGTAAISRAISGRRAQSIVNKAREGLMVADDFLIDTSGPPVGSPVHPVATGDGAIALGDGAIANGENTNAIGTEAEAVGNNSTAIGYQTSSFSNSTAIGYQAETTANNANAIGYGAKVDDVQAQAFGRFATVGAGEAFTTEVGGQNLRILRRNPSRDPLAFASTLQLADATGALHTIGADATNGLTYDGTVIRHTHSNKAVLDAVTAAYTTGEKTKLAGIASGATANQTNAYLLNRGNHTGNQAIHTITNLQEILDGKPIEIDPGNYSTAIGVDAQAIGNSSFAAGHGAEANGTNSVAVGSTAESIAPGSTAIGMASYASGNDATGIGQGARAEGERSVAIGSSALALGDNSTAIGRSSLVPESSPRSQALGYNTQVPENTPDTTIIPAKSLQLIPHSSASTLASTITLYDASGNPHVIPATVGQTHFGRTGGSPAGENTTFVISSFAQGKSMWSSTLAALISETASGFWNVKMTVSAVVYRSVATGGIYLFAGSEYTNANALGRLSPQTHAYTLIRTIDFKNVSGAIVLDARYGGQGTAGTTHVVSYDIDVTAVRTG